MSRMLEKLQKTKLVEDLDIQTIEEFNKLTKAFDPRIKPTLKAVIFESRDYGFNRFFSRQKIRYWLLKLYKEKFGFEYSNRKNIETNQKQGV